MFEPILVAILASRIAPPTYENQSKINPDANLTRKNVIFRKIAPRPYETLIFEGKGSQKHPKNQYRTLQKPLTNPTKKHLKPNAPRGTA